MQQLRQLLSTILKQCRDGEIVLEERTEFDVASPKTTRTFVGYTVRVNHQGNYGWAWGTDIEKPDSVLAQAIQFASNNHIPAPLFNQSVPYSGKAIEMSSPSLSAAQDALTKLTQRTLFQAPHLFPDIQAKTQAGFTHQVLHSFTRSGEQRGSRTLFHIQLEGHKKKHISSSLLTSNLPESIDSLIAKAAWQYAFSAPNAKHKLHTDEPAVFSEAASSSLFQHLVHTQLNPNNSRHLPTIGEKWLDPKINVTEDGCLKRGPGSVPFDAEGIIKRPTSLVEQGRVKTYLLDRLTADRLGLEPNGTAIKFWGKAPEPGYTNIVVNEGVDSLASLCQSVDSGIFIDSLIPLSSTIEPGEFFGLANVCFLLQNGKPVAQLPPHLIRGRYDQMLGSNLIGLGAERYWNGRAYTPALATEYVQLEQPDSTISLIHRPQEIWW